MKKFILGLATIFAATIGFPQAFLHTPYTTNDTPTVDARVVSLGGGGGGNAAEATNAPYQNTPGNIVVTNELASTNFQYLFTVTPLTFDTNHWFSSGCNPAQANGTFTWIAAMGMYSNSVTEELLMPTPFGVTGYYWILTQDTNYGNFDYDFGLTDQFLTNSPAAHWIPNSGVSFGNGNYLTNSSLNYRTTTVVQQNDLNGTFEGAFSGGYMTNGTINVVGNALTPQIIWDSFSNDTAIIQEAGMTNAFGYYKLVGLTPQYVTDFGFDPQDWISGTNSAGVFTNVTANYPDGMAGIASWIQSQGGRFWLGCLAGQNVSESPQGLQGVESQNVNYFINTIGIDGLFLNCDGATFTGTPQNVFEYEIALFRNKTGVNGFSKNINIILNDAVATSHYRNGAYGRIMSQANGMLTAADGSVWQSLRGAQWNNFIAGWHSNMKLLPYTRQGSYVNLSTTALFQNDTNMIKGLLGMMGVGPCTFYLDMTNYVGLQPTASLLTNQDWFFNVFKDTGGMPGQLIQSNNMSEIWLRPLTAGKWFLNFWNKDTNASYTLTASQLPFNLATMTVKDIWAQTNVSLTGTSLTCRVATNSSMSFILTPTIPPNNIASGSLPATVTNTAPIGNLQTVGGPTVLTNAVVLLSSTNGYFTYATNAGVITATFVATNLDAGQLNTGIVPMGRLSAGSTNSTSGMVSGSYFTDGTNRWTSRDGEILTNLITAPASGTNIVGETASGSLVPVTTVNSNQIASVNMGQVAGTLPLAQLPAGVSNTAAIFTTGAHIDIPAGFYDSTPASQQISTATNLVSVWAFEVANPVTLNYFLFRGDTASAGNHWGISIYKPSGSEKVYDSGALSTATGFGGSVVSVTNGFPVTVQRGWYYLAWSSDCTNAFNRQIQSSAFGSIWTSFPGTTNLAVSTSVQVGTAQNLGSGGVNPATLGNITNTSTFNVEAISFKN